MLTTPRHLVAGLTATLVVAACHHAGPMAYSAPNDRAYHAHVITAAEIEKSGATNGWEVLRRLSTMARCVETVQGVPIRCHPKRGHGSLVLQDDPMVYIDGVPLDDVKELRTLYAGDIQDVEEIGAVEATVYYGTNSNAGVILFRTKTSPGS